MYLVPIRSQHLGMYLTPISVVFDLWFERCSNFNEVMGDSERAIRKIELSFQRNVGFSLFLTYFTTL